MDYYRPAELRFLPEKEIDAIMRTVWQEECEYLSPSFEARYEFFYQYWEKVWIELHRVFPHQSQLNTKDLPEVFGIDGTFGKIRIGFEFPFPWIITESAKKNDGAFNGPYLAPTPALFVKAIERLIENQLHLDTNYFVKKSRETEKGESNGNEN